MTGPKGNKEFCFPEARPSMFPEAKVQVVVSLRSYEVLFALGRHEVLTNDT